MKKYFLDEYAAGANWHKNTIATLKWMKEKFRPSKKIQYHNADKINAQIADFLRNDLYCKANPIPQHDLGGFIVQNIAEAKEMVLNSFTLPRAQACIAINAICEANNISIEDIFEVTL